MNANSTYVQYKVNVSGNQVGTLKVAIRLKKCAILCFPKGGIRGDHVLLLTSVQINRLDKAQAEGRRVQIRMNTRHVFCLQSCQDLQLVYSLVLFTRRLVAMVLRLEMDYIYTSMINALEYRK